MKKNTPDQQFFTLENIILALNKIPFKRDMASFASYLWNSDTYNFEDPKDRSHFVERMKDTIYVFNIFDGGFLRAQDFENNLQSLERDFVKQKSKEAYYTWQKNKVEWNQNYIHH